MSTETQEEQVAELEALGALLEAAKEMHEHEQVDEWRLGDRAVEYVAAKRPDHDAAAPRLHGVQTGIYMILEEAAVAVKGVAPEINGTTFRHAYTTALAWPEEERLIEKASFSAHAAFVASRFDGKRGTTIRRLAQRSKDGYVTRDVARLKAQETAPKPPLKTPLEKTEAALVSALRRVWNPTDRIGDDDRKGISLILRQLATKVSNGEAI